ncbi:helix-turn-helix domain-containing protein [Streptomyces cyaneofuscatus]|uniref:helix-turn-helix domain-containing protein n=1 Tax=Streptomyces cyaneofuscatus TaxID=66883 RepID=UPI0037F6DF27
MIAEQKVDRLAEHATTLGEPYSRHLGGKLRDYDRRTALGLSQAELAERCGMKQPQISRIEGGGTMPTIPLLRRLARALDADLTIELTPHHAAA